MLFSKALVMISRLKIKSLNSMKSLSLIILCVVFVSATNAQIYQFRGPDRDGKFPESKLLKEWPENGPELLLEYEGVGEGWSSVISNGKHIYASGKIDSMDYLTCLNFNGERKWQVPYGRSWDQSYPNTRSSPTIEENRIYIISGLGELVCLNAETGDINWKVNVDQDYQADWHIWGVSESPLIVGDKVICSPASSAATFVAFDKISGKERWKSPGADGQRSYMSPVLSKFGGREYILGASASDLYLVDPENGSIPASYQYFDSIQWPWQPRGMIWVNSPVVKKNMIFISIGYNYPAKMLKVNEEVSAIEEVYTDTVLDNHHHGIIEVDGYLYGSNWLNSGNGNWVCLDWYTGEVKYEEKWNTKGALVFADDLLYVYEEKKGNVGLVQADPNGFKVLSSFQIEKGNGPHWSHPYIFEGKMFMRHGNFLMVYSLRDV